MKIYLMFIFFVLKTYAQISPFDAPHPNQKFNIGHESISNEYPYVQGWFQSVTISDLKNNQGYVVIDYYNLIEIDQNNKRRIIESEDYSEPKVKLSSTEGGLYSRNPNTGDFCWNKLGDMDNAFVEDGKLFVLSGKHGNRVSHWWTKRYEGKQGCKYEIEIKYKISDDVAIQIGCDFYQEPVGEGSNMIPEPWVSNWFSENGERYQVVTVPNYDSNIKFENGVDYGITTNGVFFASKRLVEHCGGTNKLYVKSNYQSWIDVPMDLVDNYWVLETGLKFKANTKVLFCFHLNPDGKSQYIPHIIVDDETVGDLNDVQSNGKEGYNFYIYPVEGMPN